MVLFCSAHEFDSLCYAIRDKAEHLKLQAKGGSMYPFLRSGDWVNLALSQGTHDDIRKGDIILFRKGDSLYLHRVLRRAGIGFIAKGDMSFGHDGVIPVDDILGRVVSTENHRRCINLDTGRNRFIAVIAANLSLVLQYPLLAARRLGHCGMAILSRIQALKVYRRIAKTMFTDAITVRAADSEDAEGLKDLYLMAGHDVRDGIARTRRTGFWLVAERKHRIIGGLTVSQSPESPGLWLIFGLEVKPRFRGLGAGRKMVKVAILRAKESGAKEVGLLVNKNAKAALGFYRSLGFLPSDVFPPELNRSSEELYLSYKIYG